MAATVPILRVARPTDRLAEVAALYRDGLGLSVRAEFEDHEGFSGVILGAPGAPYHLEFTQHETHRAGMAPTEDNLLVFYHPDPATWAAACRRMTEAGFRTVTSFNPYWDRHGRTFEDPDGYRVVLARRAWAV